MDITKFGNEKQELIPTAEKPFVPQNVVFNSTHLK